MSRLSIGGLIMKLVSATYILIFCALVVGCTGPAVQATSTTQAIQIPARIASTTPSYASIVTSTPESSQIRSFCPEANLSGNYETSRLNGNIVLSGNDISFDGQHFPSGQSQKSILLFWHINSATTTIYNLPEDQKYYYSVTSPDKEKLALTKAKTLPEESNVIVLTQGGQEDAKFVLPDDWTLFDWLNNEKLLIRQGRLVGENLDLATVDPLTGKQELLAFDLPELYSREALTSWGALTIFDPTASLVVYPQSEGSNLIAVLWDLSTKEKITSIVGGNWPRWSPDGKRLLIVADQNGQLHRRFNEIFIITLEGKITRLTFLKDHFENDQIDLPVWSPDGRYVAFWLSTILPVKTSKLAILDTETSMVDLYCKEIDPFPFRFGEDVTLGYSYYQINAAPPIWSPDSKYLLVEDNQQFISNTYLIDLQNHTLTRIAAGARPIGWLR